MPRAVVFGCAGPRLSAEEAAFFRASDPLGFILFARNCERPDQVRALVRALRGSVDRSDAPVLIDQEGGRVARLGPPHWRKAPAQGVFAELARSDRAAARHAARLNARLLAAELDGLGITVNCLPVLDLPRAGAHAIIGDRALGNDPETIAELGRAVCEGLLEGGVLPVVKHIPGHGRARADSHVALPVVEAPADDLRASDFRPFAALRDAPLAMTAHVVYAAFDPMLPATLSRTVVAGVIRGEIGFDGLLVSDDLSMGALGGTLKARAEAALSAGCDLVLHCNGRLAEMAQVAAAVGPLGGEAERRLARAQRRIEKPSPIDFKSLEAEVERMIGSVAA